MSFSRRSERASRQVAGTAVALLLLSACGSGEGATDQATADSPTTTSPSSSSASASADGSAATDDDSPDVTEPEAETQATEVPDQDNSGRHPLPDVNVFDVGAGSEINLASLDADTPILLWFYAPH